MSLVERVKTRALRTALRGLFAWERLTRGAVYDPIGRRNLDDPYPMYRRLRERDPIHPSRLVEGFVVSRYHDVIGVVRDARFSADERNSAGFERERQRRIAAGLQREQDPYNPSMLRLDPPDHTRIRSLVSRAFTPRAVQRLRPRIETLVKELLDDVHGAGELDLIEDLGYPLPVTVIAEMLGIPTEDRAQFKYWSDEIARGLGFGPLEDERRSQVASRQLESYLGEVVEKRRVEPRDDLISGMVQAEEAEDKLSTQEIYSTCLLLLVAGNETTTNLIGNGMLALLRNPDQLARLREDRSLLESTVEELLRYDSPVQATSRLAKQDIELEDGTLVRKGQQVIVLLGSANRDPEVFDEPDRLDVARSENRHVSFSLGVHHCLGAQLARLEAQIAIGALVERFEHIELATPRVEWGDNAILRGLKALPVRV
jgi:cytochrome P450